MSEAARRISRAAGAGLGTEVLHPEQMRRDKRVPIGLGKNSRLGGGCVAPYHRHESIRKGIEQQMECYCLVGFGVEIQIRRLPKIFSPVPISAPISSLQFLQFVQETTPPNIDDAKRL